MDSELGPPHPWPATPVEESSARNHIDQPHLPCRQQGLPPQTFMKLSSPRAPLADQAHSYIGQLRFHSPFKALEIHTPPFRADSTFRDRAIWVPRPPPQRFDRPLKFSSPVDNDVDPVRPPSL